MANLVDAYQFQCLHKRRIGRANKGLRSSIIELDRAINLLSLPAVVTDHAAASQPLTAPDPMRSARFLRITPDFFDSQWGQSDSVMANTDRHQPSIPHAYVTEPKAGQLREEILGKRQVYCHFLWLRFNR